MMLSFSTSIMLQTFQYFDILLHLVCFRNSLQWQDILLFQAEISSRFRIISLQPDSNILDEEITERSLAQRYQCRERVCRSLETLSLRPF